MDDRLLSVKQVAELLDCGVSTVWRDAKNGILPKQVKHGSLTRWKMSDLQKYISSLEP